MVAVMMYEVMHGDCLELMRAMPDNSVDAIVTDPPYFKVKGEAWDRQWDKPHQFIEWMGKLSEQWQRVLKPNGSLYVFASPKMAARVEVKIAERFDVLMHIVWEKGHAGRGQAAEKEAFRNWWPGSERIIFAEHYGADNIAKGEAGYAAKCDELRGFVFEPLRAYLCSVRDAAGLTTERVDEMWQAERKSKGCMAGHWFGVSQWQLPTDDNFDFLERCGLVFDRSREDLRVQYEDLRVQYEDLRRPFSVTADDQYTDVWTFPTVQAYEGKHVCEKPLALMEHIIRTSTRPGAVVLDCFAGSCATGHACLNLGRSFIGMELDERWVDAGTRRLELAKHGAKSVRAKVHDLREDCAQTNQLAMF